MNPYITFEEQQRFMPTTSATGYGNQAALQQMNQLAAQAGQTASGGGMGGLSPLAMASMLRKTTPKSDTDFLMSNYSAPSVGMNPNASMGYNIDSQSNYGIKG
jgi:hypothetical protein